MVVEKFTKLNFKDSLLARFQLNLEKFFFQFYSNPILKGQLLESVSLSGSTEVGHSLGREPKGFLVTDINTGATIYRETWTSTKIKLNASASCVVSIWIF